MARGLLLLHLHAHLPFLRHPEHARFLEEDWLFEAITETYIPLLDLLNRLENEGVPGRLSMSISPTLAAMLADGLLQERYVAHLERLLAFTESEVRRTRYVPAFAPGARHYHDRFSWCLRFFDQWYGRDLIAGFRHHYESGRLELSTVNATHGFLPGLQVHPQCVRAQLRTGVDEFRRHFGRAPDGIWLAECGYYEGLDEELARAGLGWFFLDSHGLLLGRPTPRWGVYAPIVTPSGPLAFGRDPESSRAVWSAEMGYPGDPVYREFYRDAGLELDDQYLEPLRHGPGLRTATGVKYYRITGKGVAQQPWDPQAAFDRAVVHARDFVTNRRAQTAHLAGYMDRPPLVVSPYDAELYGHWWYEGPVFLEHVLREIARDPKSLESITPTVYLGRYPVNQRVQPTFSTWGHMGYADVWIHERNEWMWPHLHGAADQLLDLLRRYPDAWGDYREALDQMARELLLAQCSDWPFILRTGTSVEYAVRRFREHLAAFQNLRAVLESGGEVPRDELARLRARNNIFPGLDARVFS